MSQLFELRPARLIARGRPGHRAGSSGRALFALLASCVLLLLAGCGDSAERARERQARAIAEGLDTANNLVHTGDIQRAVEHLETLDSAHPNQPEILEALAFAYAEQPDPALAAFYFESLYDLQPERADFPLYAASSHAADGNLEAAAQNYGAYLALEPDDAPTHRALADIYLRLNRHRDALESLLNAFRTEGEEPDARDCARVGDLYRALGNQAQAQHWYRRALEAPGHDDAHRRARMGLLHLAVNQSDWDAAQAMVAVIDSNHPGAVDTSELAPVRDQLLRYREAREALARQREQARQRQEEARLEAERLAQEEREPPEPEPPATEPVETPAADTPTDKGRPAETLYTADAEAAPAPTPAPEPAPAPPTLLEEGKAAYAEADYDRAVRLFQSALTENPASAETAYNLSRAYYQQERWSEAELLGAEATRMDPGNLVYTLNYLRAVQRSQPTDRFIRELSQAQQKHPRSPDLTLALGRAYHHLQGNTRNATFLYRQFLELAPNHPRAPEIRDTLQRMGEP